MRRLRSILAPLTLTVAVTVTALAFGSSSSSSVAVLEDCRVRVLLVPGVEKRVRERVPKRFELVRDPLGRPLLAVAGARCEQWTVRARTKPTTFGFFAAMVESPDGGGCLARYPVVGALRPDLLPVCNFYVLFGVLDNRVAVRAFRSVVPDFPAYYVRDLFFDQEGFDRTGLGAPFRFRAGPRTPSPFELVATVRDGTAARPATLSFWFKGSSGTATFREQIGDFAPGQMEGTLRAQPGSEMAHLLGTTRPDPIAGVAARYHYNVATLFPRS